MTSKPWSVWDFRSVTFLAWAVVISAPLVILAGPMWNWVTGEGITRDVGRDGKRPAIESAEGTTAHVGDVTVTWVDPDLGTRVADLAVWGVAALGALLVGTAFLRLAARTREGEPFGDGTFSALRLIGWTMVFAPPLVSLLDSIVASNVAHEAFGDRPFVGFAVTGYGLVVCFLGIGFSLVAEAFRHGQRLREDTEGLV